MYRVTLEWMEGDRVRTRTISSDDRTILPNTIRIGRNQEGKCDLVLQHPEMDIQKTVSNLHVEIFFDVQKNGFYLRNLTKDRQIVNPAIVDGRKVIAEEPRLQGNSTIQLGKMKLKIKALDVPRLNPIYVVRCSGPKQHQLEQKHVGLNCPYCGYLVPTGTMMIPTER